MDNDVQIAISSGQSTFRRTRPGARALNRTAMTEINLDKTQYSTLSEEKSRAQLMIACFYAHGLDVKMVRVKRVLSNAVEVGCVACNGDLCMPQTVRIPFEDGATVKHATSLTTERLCELLPANTVPTYRMMMIMLSQPLAIMAIGGMALLTLCVGYENDVTNMLLMTIGGRESGWPPIVLFAAFAAHICEAIYAFTVALRFPRCHILGAYFWAYLVFLVGFPVLRHVLRLRPSKRS